MGRFFNTAPIQFLQGTMYRDPHELMMRVIENDNKLRALYEQEANKAEMDLLASPHLAFDKELLEKTIGQYNGDIESITNEIYNNTDIAGSTSKKMKDLQKRIMKDRLNGDLYHIGNRYNAMQAFMKDNEKLREEDPTTYNLAMAYEMNRLKEETAKDKTAGFSSYKVIGKPKFREDLIKEIDKLKASENEVPDGNGYMVKVKNLTPDRIRELAVSSVLSRPEYAEYARQQTRYGRNGFYNEDGSSINPYMLVGPNGEPILDVNALSPEDRLKVRTVLNPNWAFSSELSGIINANAYTQRNMDSDSTWMGKFKEAGENSRFQQRLALDMAKFNHEVAKDQRDFEYKKYTDDRDFSLKISGGGSGSGSGGGKGGDGLLNPNLGAPGTINIQNLNDDRVDMAHDMRNYSKSGAARARLEKSFVAGINASSAAKTNFVNGISLGDHLKTAISKGIDVSSPDKIRRYLHAHFDAELKKSKGIVKVGKTYYDNAAEAATAMANFTHGILKGSQQQYNSFVQTERSSLAIGLNPLNASTTLTQVHQDFLHNPHQEMIDQDGNRLVGAAAQQELWKVMKDKNYEVRVAPGSDTYNGGTIHITIGSKYGQSEDHQGVSANKFKTYTIRTARGTDNSSVHQAISRARNQYRPTDTEYYTLSPFMQSFYNGHNANLSTIVPSQADLREFSRDFGVDMSRIHRAAINIKKGTVSIQTKSGKNIEVNIAPAYAQGDITHIGVGAIQAIAAAADNINALQE